MKRARDLEFSTTQVACLLVILILSSLQLSRGHRCLELALLAKPWCKHPDVPASRGVGVRIPVLVYHHISRTPRSFISISPATFERHLQYLKANAFRTIGVSEIDAFLRNRPQSSERVVALTFDDGNVSFYDEAFPLLQKYGFTASIFVITSQVGHEGKMSWEELRDLSRKGVDVESHSVSHTSLLIREGESSLHYQQRLETELLNSRRQLANRLGASVESFAYPFGWYDGSVLSFIERTPFIIAFTVNEGTNTVRTSRYLLRRQSIFRKDTFEDFKAKINYFDLEISEEVPPDQSRNIPYEVALSAKLRDPSHIQCLEYDLDLRPFPAINMDGRCVSLKQRVSNGFHYVTLKGKTRNGALYETSWGFVAGTESRNRRQAVSAK